METSALIKSLVREGQLLAAAAESAGPEAPVPTCPGWQVRHLLRHTGMVHRWATSFVTEGYTAYHPDAGEPDLDGDELLEWFREGHGLLVAALSEAPADLECWSFLPAPSPLAFWARRQAHETAVHRADAESAADGKPGPVAADFAVDGIDELLSAFHARPKSRVRTETPKLLRVAATDTGDVWTVRLSQEPARTERGGEGPCDCELTGPAERLYLTLWNRLPLDAVSVTGDAAPARLWRERSGITWS
ncbi:maleylpyruvate isomerase family mycothiol-dependent enzyme [Streptomyces sp. NPDC015127]|uniref:maleylpyruvate isomerase family mycothiol-dependent enzyme n=1 Tax=Streptomyces sp. NPDC015127 TaxID=3364939 RepID=UPI0036F8E48D